VQFERVSESSSGYTQSHNHLSCPHRAFSLSQHTVKDPATGAITETVYGPGSVINADILDPAAAATAASCSRATVRVLLPQPPTPAASSPASSTTTTVIATGCQSCNGGMVHIIESPTCPTTEGSSVWLPAPEPVVFLRLTQQAYMRYRRTAELAVGCAITGHLGGRHVVARISHLTSSSCLCTLALTGCCRRRRFCRGTRRASRTLPAASPASRAPTPRRALRRRCPIRQRPRAHDVVASGRNADGPSAGRPNGTNARRHCFRSAARCCHRSAKYGRRGPSPV